MKTLYIFLICCIGFSITSAAQSKTITQLPKETFKDSITTQQVVLLDVRTPKEYNAGSIAYAKNIDFLDTSTFIEEVNKLDKDKSLYIFCRSGNRSGKASKVLDSLGFKTIYDLKGGYLEFTEKE